MPQKYNQMVGCHQKYTFPMGKTPKLMTHRELVNYLSQNFAKNRKNREKSRKTCEKIRKMTKHREKKRNITKQPDKSRNNGENHEKS